MPSKRASAALNRWAALAMIMFATSSATAVDAPAGARGAERPFDACRRASAMGNEAAGTALRVCEGALASARSNDERMAIHAMVASAHFTLAAVGLDDNLETLVRRLDAGRRREVEASVQHYSEALTFASKSPLQYFLFWNRGFSREVLGRTQEALDDYGQALRLKPDFVQGYVDRARVLEALGRRADATADLDRAATLAPYDPAVVKGRKALQGTTGH